MGRFNPFENFNVNAEFGLRNAVVPLFRVRSDGKYLGLGTAFVAGPYDHLITAHHVVGDLTLRSLSHRATIPLKQPPPTDRILALLLPGLIFGTVRVPDSCLKWITEGQTPYIPTADPMRELLGETSYTPLDIAFLKIEVDCSDPIGHLEISSSNAVVEEGDTVVAIGFSHLRSNLRELKSYTREQTDSEHLCAAFGVVKKVYPEVGARGLTYPSPFFLVEGNWLCGMSGGPVFNMEGQVVGLVSTGVEEETDSGTPGRATAVLLSREPIYAGDF